MVTIVEGRRSLLNSGQLDSNKEGRSMLNERDPKIKELKIRLEGIA